MAFNLISGDCLSVLAELPESSIDAVVTDPPYELGFMGKSWDASGVAFSPDTWRLVWRVMKPGAHLVAFGAPKNYHRLACAIEDAGFEIRDSLMWVFGSGFPKSLDVSKAIDKAAGAEREVVGPNKWADRGGLVQANTYGTPSRPDTTAPATSAAREWQGWGTALKPAYEPIVLARKPLSEGTVAANVLRWGTGALNIDATRIGDNAGWSYPNGRGGQGWQGRESLSSNLSEPIAATKGRWPANLCHDGSQDVLDLFPYSKSTGGKNTNGHDGAMRMGRTSGQGSNAGGLGDEGSAARFFYCAKASKNDRAGSKHPTVKPVALMRWLARLVAPPGGTILDPFAGSGTTGQAAIEEGFNVTLIEREAEYIADIERRLSPLITAAE